MFKRFVLALLALFVGGSTVILSLGNPTVATGADNKSSSSTQKLYFDADIVPGHILYPFIAVKDQIVLNTIDKHKELDTRLEYANRRLQYARILLQKGDQQRSLSTLTKAEKYLHIMCYEKGDDLTEEEKNKIRTTIAYHQKNIEAFKDNYSDTRRAEVDKLRAENTVYLTKLK